MILVTLLFGVSTAHAAFPGQNGKIAFSSSLNVYATNPDGGGRTTIATNPGDPRWDIAREPEWSPDGNRLVYWTNDFDTGDTKAS